MTATRRAAIAAAATLAFAPRAFAQWSPAVGYPDPAVRVLDPSFGQYRLALAAVERIAHGGGMRWNEGPVYMGDQRALLWSDIPNNRLLRWDEETGRMSVFRRPSNNSNGNTRDRQGRLITCEHDSRSVTRTEYDGTITTLADRYDGKRLNSPNDVVVKSDGTIWFTDPPFGILGYYEGTKSEAELPTNVYRLDPRDGRLTVATGDVRRPNGLAFSPDEKKLYIVEAGVLPRVIRSFDVADDGRLSGGATLIEAGQGTPDGFKVDVDGNLWCGWGMGDKELDGVMVFNAQGKPIGRIALPERCANLCFGGVRRNRLFMTASQSVYSLYVNTQGVAYA